MSTDRPPLDDLDLSAILDGEASADVRDRLAQDPAAQARLDQLRSAQAALMAATVAALPTTEVDELVAAALHAAGGQAPVVAEPEPEPVTTDDPLVTPLVSRRRKPVPPWLVAAVVVVLVGLGITLVWDGRDDADDNFAFETVGQSIRTEERSGEGTAGDNAPASEMAEDDISASSPTEAGAATPDGDAAATTTAPTADRPGLVELGTFEDADALRVTLRDSFPTATADTTTFDDTLAAAADRCLAKVDGLFQTFGPPTATGTAVVAGEDVLVYELPYRTDDGRDTSLVMAVGEQSCIPVLTFQR